MPAIPLFSIILGVAWSSLIEFISLTGGLVLCGFILGYLERLSNRNMVRSFGIKGIYFTAWLGTPVHELGHAAMCLIFGHRVTGIKLIQASGADGTIGYVTHTFNPNSLYQKIGNFFIGLAPLISGSLAIFLSTYLFVPGSYTLIFHYLGEKQNFSLFEPTTWDAFVNTVQSVFASLFFISHLADLKYWLFFILALCIASHMSLSPADIRGAASGAGALFLLIAVANALSTVLDPPLNSQMTAVIGRFNFCLLLLLSLAVLFSAMKLLISGLFNWGFHGLKRM
ncbi:hypothetical protein [Sporolactobacillus pectinivorans]|uniref:hypothetical protein n=1 Tax=Sporolactobacillus pectinivorans TaxID=1591408 RepID=UPI000C2646BE|nr:hypothetical protein [Sporolactobacillus pectinivorans]